MASIVLRASDFIRRRGIDHEENCSEVVNSSDLFTFHYNSERSVTSYTDIVVVSIVDRYHGNFFDFTPIPIRLSGRIWRHV